MTEHTLPAPNVRDKLRWGGNERIRQRREAIDVAIYLRFIMAMCIVVCGIDRARIFRWLGGGLVSLGALRGIIFLAGFPLQFI